MKTIVRTREEELMATRPNIERNRKRYSRSDRRGGRAVIRKELNELF